MPVPRKSANIAANIETGPVDGGGDFVLLAGAALAAALMTTAPARTNIGTAKILFILSPGPVHTPGCVRMLALLSASFVHGMRQCFPRACGGEATPASR